MAAQQASDSQPQALHWPVLPQRLYCILAARGRESARGRREWRDKPLIEADGQDEQLRQELADVFQL